jgi:hypothetical protein
LPSIRHDASGKIERHWELMDRGGLRSSLGNFGGFAHGID